jgi:predicted metal-dependent hydrolase
VLATIVLLGFWWLGAAMLMRQEDPRPLRARARDVWEVLRHGAGRRIARSFVRYLSPAFHPSAIENEHLARSYLEAIGRADA